jgi:hypothetical protein
VDSLQVPSIDVGVASDTIVIAEFFVVVFAVDVGD